MVALSSPRLTRERNLCPHHPGPQHGTAELRVTGPLHEPEPAKAVPVGVGCSWPEPPTSSLIEEETNAGARGS